MVKGNQNDSNNLGGLPKTNWNSQQCNSYRTRLTINASQLHLRELGPFSQKFQHLAECGIFILVLDQSYRNDQTAQQIALNDVTTVIQAIDEFYIVLPDPELSFRGLVVSTIRVGVHWHIRILQAVFAVAAKDSAIIDQIVSEELMKFLYYLGTQAIFNKYHSDLDPKALLTISMVKSS